MVRRWSPAHPAVLVGGHGAGHGGKGGAGRFARQRCSVAFWRRAHRLRPRCARAPWARRGPIEHVDVHGTQRSGPHRVDQGPRRGRPGPSDHRSGERLPECVHQLRSRAVELVRRGHRDVAHARWTRGSAKGDPSAATNLADRSDTVCSVLTLPIVQSGSWSMSGLALRPQMLDSGNAGDSSVAGILGADTLAHEKWVVLDYAGGLVVLG